MGLLYLYHYFCQRRPNTRWNCFYYVDETPVILNKWQWSSEIFGSSSSDAASEAPRLPLLPPRRCPLPARWAGGSEGVTLRGGLRHRGERGDRKPHAQRHCSSHRPPSEPGAQKPLCNAAQPGPAVSAAAAWAQVKEQSVFFFDNCV